MAVVKTSVLELFTRLIEHGALFVMSTKLRWASLQFGLGWGSSSTNRWSSLSVKRNLLVANVWWFCMWEEYTLSEWVSAFMGIFL